MGGFMTTKQTLISLIDNWRVSQGLPLDVALTETQVAVFAKALQEQFASV
jgi:hypothetical protein